MSSPIINALRELADAVSAAADAASPAGPTITPSWPETMDKAAIDGKFAGAILELNDGTFRLIAARPSRVRADSLDMVVSAAKKTSKTEYKQSDWMDSDIKRHTAPLVGAAGIMLGASAATVIMQAEAEGTDFTAIIIKTMGVQPFPKPISDGLGMLSHANGDKLVWYDWVKRDAAGAPIPPPTPASIAADRLGDPSSALRLLLTALNVVPVADGFDATILAGWLAAVAQISTRTPAVRAALVAPPPASDSILAAVANAVGRLATADRNAFAAAAEDALDEWRQLPAGVPSEAHVVVAVAFADRMLAAASAAAAAPAGASAPDPASSGSEAEEEGAPLAPGFAANGSPNTLAYIARLERITRNDSSPRPALHSGLTTGASPADARMRTLTFGTATPGAASPPPGRATRSPLLSRSGVSPPHLRPALGPPPPCH